MSRFCWHCIVHLFCCGYIGWVSVFVRYMCWLFWQINKIQPSFDAWSMISIAIESEQIIWVTCLSRAWINTAGFWSGFDFLFCTKPSPGDVSRGALCCIAFYSFIYFEQSRCVLYHMRTFKSRQQFKTLWFKVRYGGWEWKRYEGVERRSGGSSGVRELREMMIVFDNLRWLRSGNLTV